MLDFPLQHPQQRKTTRQNRKRKIAKRGHFLKIIPLDYRWPERILCSLPSSLRVCGHWWDPAQGWPRPYPVKSCSQRAPTYHPHRASGHRTGFSPNAPGALQLLSPQPCWPPFSFLFLDCAKVFSTQDPHRFLSLDPFDPPPLCYQNLLTSGEGRV